MNYSKMFRLNLSLGKFQEKASVERRPATKEQFGLVDVDSRYQHITAHQAQFGHLGRLIIWVSLYLRRWLNDFGHQTQTAPVRETLAESPLIIRYDTFTFRNYSCEF